MAQKFPDNTGHQHSFPDDATPDDMSGALASIGVKMSPDEIAQAISASMAPNKPRPQSGPARFLSNVLTQLPGGLAMAGQEVGSLAGPEGSATGSILGGSTGEAIRQAAGPFVGQAPQPDLLTALKNVGKAGAEQGLLGKAGTMIGSGVSKLAAPIMKTAMASPQLPRYLAQGNDLIPNLLARGSTVGGENGSAAAGAAVSDAMKEMAPLLQLAHDQGYAVTPETLRPAFEQELEKRFTNRTIDSPDVTNAMRAKFNNWADQMRTYLRPGASPTSTLASDRIPAPPLGAFEIHGLKQGSDKAAEAVYAARDKAEQGLFPPPSQAEIDNADFNKMMADIFRKDLERVGSGGKGSIGAAIKAVNAKAAPLIQQHNALLAAENAGVPRSQSVRPLDLVHGFNLHAPIGPAASRIANFTNQPATADVLGQLPRGLAMLLQSLNPQEVEQ